MVVKNTEDKTFKKLRLVKCKKIRAGNKKNLIQTAPVQKPSVLNLWRCSSNLQWSWRYALFLLLVSAKILTNTSNDKMCCENKNGQSKG